MSEGVESYVLYAMIFLHLSLSLLVYKMIVVAADAYLVSAAAYARTVNILIFFSLLIPVVFYFHTIGFIPPNTSAPLKVEPLYPNLMIFMLVLLCAQYFLNRKSISLANVFILSLLIPICFIPADGISVYDYSFVWAPALRLLQGASLSDIYFHYDLLISLPAALWMKLGMSLNASQAIAQIAFFLFFCGIFLFSRKFLLCKQNAILLVIALVIFKLYAWPDDPTSIIAVSPIRLDLWLPLLVLAYFKGPYHWLVGLTLGCLMILHRIFGAIYFVSYVTLIFSLFVIDVSDSNVTIKSMPKHIKSIFLRHLSLNIFNFIIVLACIAVARLLFGNFINPSLVLNSPQIGSPTPVGAQSFYWHLPTIFSMTVVMLIAKRRALSKQYLTTALLTVFLAAGNLLYFLGRSHENNIVNVSGCLFLVFFILLDLLTLNENAKMPTTEQRNAQPWNAVNARLLFIALVPYILILGLTYYYERNLILMNLRKSEIFTASLLNREGSFYPEMVGTIPDANELASIREVTNNSDHVYFGFREDFLLYYEGGHKLVGYFNPHDSWYFRKDYIAFTQDLLNKGYYVVFRNDHSKFRAARGYPAFKYKQLKTNEKFVSIHQ